MDATNAINVFDAVDEEEEDRGGWGNKLDFLFSCISVSVGLGSKNNKLTFLLNRDRILQVTIMLQELGKDGR